MRKRHISFSFIALAALLEVITFINCFSQDTTTIVTAGANRQDRIVTVSAVGDLMFGTSYPSVRYLPPHDKPELLVGSLADTLRQSDITFGNLEGSFLDAGDPVKRCRDTNICYLFRMPERYSSVLGHCGFDLLSLANNHFGDFGWPAAMTTTKLLDGLGIRYAGIPGSDFTIMKLDTLEVGFCAFSPTAGAIDINDLEKTSGIVRYLDQTCDLVIVSFHGGAEGNAFQRVTRTNEIFYGENRGNVYEFTHAMIDNGADIVLGHGPHVPRAVELYRDRLIVYSLGNFCTYGRFNLQGPNGLAPLINIKVDATGKFISGRIIPAVQDHSGVSYDYKKRVVEKIRELTTLDFPETGIFITPEGGIFRKN